MRAPNLSIRGMLLLTVGGLTALIALFAAYDVYENGRRLVRIESLRDASVLGDQIFDAVDKLAVERDVALSMLQSTDKDVIQDLKPRLLETRKAADLAMAATVEGLKRYAFAELVDLRDRSLKRLAAIKALRAQVDRDAGLAKAARDHALPGKWSGEVSALIADTDGLWVAFLKHFTDIDPIVSQHLRIKHLLREIIEYSGRERSQIGQLITENVGPTPAQVAALLRGKGAIDLSWQMSRVIAEQSGLYKSIAPAFVDARSHYDTMHEMIQDMFYVPGARHGAAYPISVALWFELSTEASDSLAALRDATIREARKYTDNLMAASRASIVFWAAVLAAALALCAYSFWVIVRRVINPINRMIEALLAAARGETVQFDVGEGRDDEIGKLGDVLHAFHTNAEEIKTAATKLERSESRLRAVVDHTIDGMITIDATGAIISFNPACEGLFGYGAEEAIGQDVRMLVPENEQAVLNAYFLSSIETASGYGEVPPSRELHGRRKNGTIVPIELTLSPYRFDGRQKFSAIIRDITRRKEAEHELAQHTRALERSNKELDDFAYIASHDLKEPLRGIHNHSRFLLEDNGEKLDEESVGRLSRLVFLSQRMERLVNDLLYFSRLGRQELAIQPTDVVGVVTDIESTLELFLSEHNAKIVVGTELPKIVCDKTRVTELFRNLITNAVKYNDAPEKVVEVGWKAAHPTMEGATARNVFYVKDNGRGIDREFHTEIFRIFKRLQAASEKEEGTGVGLTFVKKIVERHGGRIWLESELGKGTTFYFTLEATRDERDSDAQAAA
ncbi:MAG: PAS domain S-box protein [Alphaproteobacteria bacterium]|nr:PAS domain S-box protein [Alphaproteobacteria bacterium]